MKTNETIIKKSQESEVVWAPAYHKFVKIVNRFGFKTGIEIGVAFGGHSETILRETKVGKLYGVDSYKHFPGYNDPMNLPQSEFDQLYTFVIDRLSKYGDRFSLIRSNSSEASTQIPGIVDFIYIDGDHSYDGVKRDICSWFDKIRNDGIIAGHDYDHPNFPGVKKAVHEFFDRFGWNINSEGDGVWWVEKRKINISFFIPAYNCGETIKESIDSIKNENFEAGDEIIICDDCSTDQTTALLKKLASNDPTLKIVFHNRNKGGGATRNTAIENSNNSILFCLDSDNILVPNSILPLKTYLINNCLDIAAFSELQYFRENVTKISHNWQFNQTLYELQDMLKNVHVPPASGNYMFTKESWIAANGYPESAGALDAWGFGFRQLAANCKMGVLPYSKYLHRLSDNSYWVRESRAGRISISAIGILLPFLNKIHESDLRYIFSKKARYTWFENIEKKPIRLKSNQHGNYLFAMKKNQ